MAEIGANDPRELIASFVCELPQTIRTEMLLFLLVYAVGINPPDKTEDFEKAAKDYLLRSGMPGIGAVICSAAVIDHTLEGLVSRLDNAEAALKMLTTEDPENLAFQRSHLSLPMRKRHWEQALAEWKNLRLTKLTSQTLQDFEQNQLNPRRRQ